MGINQWKVAEGASKCRQDLAPSNDQIKDFVTKESGKKVNNSGNNNLLQVTAEMLYFAQTNEEKIAHGILNQWDEGAHGFVPMEKEKGIIRLRCKNVNSLGIYNQKGSKMRQIYKSI